MSREEIGSYLGLKLETVSRTFSKFQANGLLFVRHRQIQVTDPVGLQELIDGYAAPRAAVSAGGGCLECDVACWRWRRFGQVAQDSLLPSGAEHGGAAARAAQAGALEHHAHGHGRDGNADRRQREQKHRQQRVERHRDGRFSRAA